MGIMFESYLEFANDGDGVIELVLEPWAYSIFLDPNSRLLVTISCNAKGTPFIAVSEDIISIFLWTVCTCSISIDGVEQVTPFLRVSPP